VLAPAPHPAEGIVSLAGLDVGTSTCKGLLFSAGGRRLAAAHVEYPLSFPQVGWVELDADLVWQAVQTILGRLAHRAAEIGDPLRAVAFSASGDEAVPVDTTGRVLDSCIMSMDSRTADLVAWWDSEIGGERVHELTGLPLAPNWPLLRLMWLRSHKPQVFSAASQMLCWEDLMLARLTGQAVTDHSLASRTMAFDIRRREWSKEILDRALIPSTMFPRSVPPGTVVGEVSAAKAGQLGLNRGVLVVAGGFDQAMAALGAGLLTPGDAVVGTGTWEALTVLTPAPTVTALLRAGGYSCGCYVAGDAYYCMATNPGGGSVLRWFRDTFGQQEVETAQQGGTDAFDILLRQIPDGPTGMLVLPHFEGSYTPWMDPGSAGAIVGLRLSTTKAGFVKALLEGITFELMENITRMQAAGVAVGELRATGGGARSPVWLQLKADITGRRVTGVAMEEAGCVAAACLAGVGAGVFRSIEEALARFVRIAEIYEPRPEVHEAYLGLFARYRGFYQAVRPLVAGR